MQQQRIKLSFKHAFVRNLRIATSNVRHLSLEYTSEQIVVSQLNRIC